MIFTYRLQVQKKLPEYVKPVAETMRQLDKRIFNGSADLKGIAMLLADQLDKTKKKDDSVRMRFFEAPSNDAGWMYIIKTLKGSSVVVLASLSFVRIRGAVLWDAATQTFVDYDISQERLTREHLERKGGAV